MDTPLDLPSTSSLVGSATSEVDNLKTMWAPTTVQETWLGAGGEGGSADEGFLGSLEAGGALMSAGGGWSLSTLPGEEGLRWTGAVKTEQEVFDEWAGVGGGVPLQQQAILHPSPLLGTGQVPAEAEAAGATAGAAGSSSIAKVTGKLDAEEGWKSFVGPASTSLPPSKDAKRLDGETEIAATPTTAAAASQGSFKLPVAWPAATHSAVSSTKDNIAALKRQRSSPPSGPSTAPAAATATPPLPLPRAASKTTTTRAAAAPPPSDAPPTAITTRTRRSAAAAAAVAGPSTTTSLSPVKAELAEEEDEDAGEDDDDDDDDEEYTTAGARKTATSKKKTAANSNRAAADSEDDYDLDDDPVGSELTDKRRRNREHAKRSRLRKRVRLGGLEEMVLGLRRENVRLRQMVMRGIPDRAGSIIRACAKDNTNADLVAKQDVVQGMRPGMSVGSSSSSWSARGGTRSRPKLEGGSSSRKRGSGGRGGGTGSKDRRVPSALKLMSPCYQTVKALADSQANFILTNPNLPDCPIIFASQGFLELTGYEGKDVIGRNCRLLQGPGTDPITLSIVRDNVEAGRDASVCILNYKKDGAPFWNQLSIGVLLDAHGQVANHVAVMYEVNPMPPAVFHRLLHRVPLPESLLNDDSGSDSDGEINSKDRRDPVERSEVAAGSFNHSSVGGGSSRSSSAGGDGGGSGAGAAAPRVVDRLRRTRAAAAAISNGDGSNK
uniref:Putative LOV domain-containing protein n=1 Tax=Petalonia fascia TaxID=2893 RepID=A0A126X3Q0_PETFA|nr:putative LOV domain-containing protein [Petalonia fascia]